MLCKKLTNVDTVVLNYLLAQLSGILVFVSFVALQLCK